MNGETMAFFLKQMVKQRHMPPRRPLSEGAEECLNVEDRHREWKMAALQTVQEVSGVCKDPKDSHQKKKRSDGLGMWLNGTKFKWKTTQKPYGKATLCLWVNSLRLYTWLS